MMKQLGLLICLTVAVTSVFGAGLCTDSANIGANVLTPGFSCQLGPLYFSNFTATASGLSGAPIIWLGSGVSGNETGFSNGVANLYFNTNFNVPATTLRTISFTFEVTGPVNAIDAWLGGSGNRTLTEYACDTVDCDASSAFATLTLTPTNTTGSTDLGTTTTTLWVTKEMVIQPGAGLSHFSQSFHAIPEPLAMVLVGSGLLGLGLLRKRLRG
jgi:hypothetical protein